MKLILQEYSDSPTISSHSFGFMSLFW